MFSFDSNIESSALTYWNKCYPVILTLGLTTANSYANTLDESDDVYDIFSCEIKYGIGQHDCNTITSKNKNFFTALNIFEYY
jgi:hypothetical protein